MSKLIFNGHDFSDLFVCGEPEYSMLVSSTQYADIENRNGSVVLGRTWGDSTVTFSLGIDGTAAERRNKLSTLGYWLAVDEPKKLHVPDMPGRYFMAVPDGGIETTRGVDGEIARLTFKMVDPIAYGNEITVTVPSGGSVTFNVDGTAAAKPTITASAAIRNSSAFVWGLRLDDGDFVHVATGSASARSVAIDCDERTCIVNNSVKVPTLDSDWLELTPGVHTLRMDYGTGTATVTYRERWL